LFGTPVFFGGHWIAMQCVTVIPIIGHHPKVPTVGNTSNQSITGWWFGTMEFYVVPCNLANLGAEVIEEDKYS